MDVAHPGSRSGWAGKWNGLDTSSWGEVYVECRPSHGTKNTLYLSYIKSQNIPYLSALIFFNSSESKSFQPKWDEIYSYLNKNFLG